MTKIIQLSSEIYNKISAGEVVERPASVVKELVENSIDAGATKIVITVTGDDSISVNDNGCGIVSEQLLTAFLPHSTSKIATADDLSTISTLGFRGEALASIASVSRVVVTSRTKEEEFATRVTLQGGTEVSSDNVQREVGTTIEISDLFFNTPARKKFLRTRQRENSEITNFVSRLILTNPNLEITYILDGIEVFRINGKGLEEAIYVVYGKNCLANCIKVDSFYKSIKVNGYVGAPDYFKANSTYQTIQINGRYVCDSTIAAGIKNAYKSYLMTRQYPFYVLDFTMPYENIDVNVHPNKLEVRFKDSQEVYLSAYLSVKDALTSFSHSAIKEEVYKSVRRSEPHITNLGEQVGFQVISSNSSATDTSKLSVIGNEEKKKNYDNGIDPKGQISKNYGGRSENESRLRLNNEGNTEREGNPSERIGRTVDYYDRKDEKKSSVTDSDEKVSEIDKNIDEYSRRLSENSIENHNCAHSLGINSQNCESATSENFSKRDNNSYQNFPNSFGLDGNKISADEMAKRDLGLSAKTKYGGVNSDNNSKGSFEPNSTNNSEYSNFDNNNSVDNEVNNFFNFDIKDEELYVASPAIKIDSNKRSVTLFENARYIGTIFNSYILLEKGDFMFIVDQHAAHERVLFDSFMLQNSCDDIVAQELLVPYVFETSAKETGYLLDNLDNFKKCGFGVEQFGANAFKITAIPNVFWGMQLDKFVKNILNSINYFDMSTSVLTADVLAKKACKAAFKAGDKLNKVDIMSLISILDTNNNLKCPHGRPLVVIYTKTDFEKWFKRII